MAIAYTAVCLPVMRRMWKNEATRPHGLGSLIDHDGFRPNVGIILSNQDRRLFWGRRVGQNAWQFPQGGIHSDETPEQAMYRELEEEVGLQSRQVTILGCTRGWLRYHLPKRYIRRHCGPTCIGQKQVWFLLQFLGDDRQVQLDAVTAPEFDEFRWVDFWYPAENVIPFKRRVYTRALRHFEPLLPSPITSR
jgi:putative (di)nucleoside polyphosphate hydrolase